MYAIIEDSGTQIKVSDGDVIDIDLRDVSGGDSITFDRVLMVGEGESATIGTPYVSGASVTAEVVREFKDRKIDVIKYKRRKGYKVKHGHRQSYIRVKVTGISS